MSKLSWELRAAKRVVAEAALRAALQEIESARGTGGARTYRTSSEYKIAKHLALHAAEQLRMSEAAE